MSAIRLGSRSVQKMKSALPDRGFIVSCYLESMYGCEREFIDAVMLNCPEVKALRVEGEENIKYAVDMSRKYIIGLIKQENKYGAYITSTERNVKRVIDAGANMVAIDSRLINEEVWDNKLYDASTIPIMADVRILDEALDAHKLGASIIATTFQQKGFILAQGIKQRLPNALVNLEGGIQTPSEVQHAFDIGCDYVTVGKMINDPPTITKYLVSDIL